MTAPLDCIPASQTQILNGPPGQSLEVTVSRRVRHAALLRAAREFGGYDSFACHLGISRSTLAVWINLRAIPAIASGQGNGRGWGYRWPEIERKLVEATGQTIKQLFPAFIRDGQFLQEPKYQEEEFLLHAADVYRLQEARQARLSTPVDVLEMTDLKERMVDLLKTLTFKEREILKLRYGLEENDGHT